jgi:uncharacterized protein YukE
MTLQGMDAGVVRDVANRVDAQAEQLLRAVSAIDNLVQQCAQAWRGQDAHDFVGWWQSQHKPALQRAHDSLAGLAQSARNNASDQDTASHASGASVPAVTPTANGASHATAAHPTPVSAASSVAGYAVGPQHLSNSRIADAAEAELRDHPGAMPTGWSQPGECMVSAQRWVEAAGGHVNRDGEVAGSYSGVAAQVPLADAQRGDIIQYVDPAAPNTDWDHVHTVVVVGRNNDGSYQIIERNFDLKGGIRRDDSWTPSPHAGWVAEAYRYGDAP